MIGKIFVVLSYALVTHGRQVAIEGPAIGPKFHHLKAAKTFNEAENTCRHQTNGPWALPAPSSGVDMKSLHRDLVIYMKSAGVNETWLPLKPGLSYWRNIDESQYGGQMQEDSNKDKKCGSLKLTYEAVISDFCGHSGQGYICEIPDCLECPPEVSPYNCVRDGDACYLLGCDVGGWFEASNRCVAMATRLAVMKTEEQVAHIVKSIEKRLERKCRRYWTGLIKEKWAFNSKDYRGEESPNLYFWSENEPNPSHDCAIVQKYEDGFYWKSVNCSSRHHFICMKTGTSHHQSNTSSMNVTSPTPHNENLVNNATNNIREPKSDGGIASQLNRIFYFILSIVIILFIIIVLVFIILCLIKRQSTLTYVELPTQL